MGRRDHANIDGDRLAADRRDHALLQGPQDFRLHGERHVADLVEKERAAVGIAERARTVAAAPVKAPLIWPNSSLSSSSAGIAAQFTATKGLALRRPWSCNARATSSLPVPVSPRIRTVASLSAAMPIAFCTRRIASLAPISAVSLDSRHVPRAIAHRRGGSIADRRRVQVIAADRLGQMVEGAEPHRLDGVLGAGESRQHRDGRCMSARPDPAQNLDAVHAARHPEIEQHGIDPIRGKPAESFARRSPPSLADGRDRRPLRRARRADPHRHRQSGWSAWQLDLEGGAFLTGSQRASPLMRARDLAHDRKPESGAIGAAGHEGLEQALTNLVRHAGAGVVNAQRKPSVRGMGRDFNASPLGGMLDRIEDEIAQRPADLLRIETGQDESQARRWRCRGVPLSRLPVRHVFPLRA